MSSAETAAVLERCASVVNDSKTRKRAVNLLKKSDREAMENEKKGEQAKIMRAHAMPWLGIDKNEIVASNQRIRDIDRQLEDQSPLPYVTPDTRDALHNRVEQLNAEIREGMLSREEMRRNPPGAVDRHIRWERANKNKILERKNLLRQLEPDSDARDLANIEMIRPETAMPNGTATFMADAQIPGIFGMSPQAKANWPQGFGENVNSALEQVKQAQTAKPVKECACGCGGTFTRGNSRRKYIPGHGPMDTGTLRKLTEIDGQLECACGCREMFTPTRTGQRYVNGTHRRKAVVKRQQARREMALTGEG